jgi:hypothetical protein
MMAGSFSTAINLKVQYKAGNLLISYATVGFSRRPPLNEVNS